MSKRATTINDVAQRCGVSKVTVSYVLNNREGRVKISDATKRLVAEAAREMGYHPNALARGLSRRRTDSITLVMQYASLFSVNLGFINELMLGVTEKASELNYDLMLHTKNVPDLFEEVAALTDGRVDGALLLRDYDDPLASALAERGFPVVQIFSHSPDSSLYSVDCDNVRGAYIATNYLISLGHRRIAHISGSPHAASASERREGYRCALNQAGIAFREDWCMEIHNSRADFTPVRELMSPARPSKDVPTAIFCWSDDTAATTMMVLRDSYGLDIPGDVSIIGYDSTTICDSTNPPLSSVRQPIYDMAARGIEMLVSIIQSNEPAERQVRFDPVLDIRSSCAPPRIQ